MTVKQAKEELKIDVEELAQLIGASVGTVRNWSSSSVPHWAIISIKAQIELKECRKFKNTLKQFLEIV